MDHIFRIDPSLPLCWESTEVLRIGFDRAEVRLHQPSARVQRFLSYLRCGLAESELAAASSRLGLKVPERTQLLDKLSAVLQRAPTHTEERRPWLTVIGSSAFCERLRERLRDAGLRVTDKRLDHMDGFVIVVERFLSPAKNMHDFLIAGTPHIPIRFTDRSMWVGPLVLAGGSPCLACLELHRLDADPALAVLAAQLVTHTPGAEVESCIEPAVALITSMVRKYSLGEVAGSAQAFCYTVQNGVPDLLPSTHVIAPHEECGCVSLSQSIAAKSQTGLCYEP